MALVVCLIMIMTDDAAMKEKVDLGILGDLKHSSVEFTQLRSKPEGSSSNRMSHLC